MKHQKKFLESVEGVGEKIADRIIEHFGDELENVLRYNPERLEEVKDIGPWRTNAVMEAVYWRFQVMALMKQNFEPIEYLGYGYRVFIANPDAEKEEEAETWQDLVREHEIKAFKKAIHVANEELETWRDRRFRWKFKLAKQMEDIFQDQEMEFSERMAMIQELKEELLMVGRCYENITLKELHTWFIERDIDEFSPELLGWEFLRPEFDDWFNQSVGPDRAHTKTIRVAWYEEEDVNQWPQAELPDANIDHFKHLKEKQLHIFELMVFSVKTALINNDGRALYQLNQKFRKLWHHRLDGLSQARGIRSTCFCHPRDENCGNGTYEHLKQIFDRAWKYYKRQNR